MGESRPQTASRLSITGWSGPVQAAFWMISGAAVFATMNGVVRYTADLGMHPFQIAFFRNAFALAMAPLPTNARELGAKVETVTDPVTGLSIRSRIYYVGDSSEIHVALDVLYGVKTLDPNLVMRMRD